MQKSKYGIVVNSNHSMESKVVLAIYVNQIGLVNAYACVCACACVFWKQTYFSQTLERNEKSLEHDLFLAWVLARFNFMLKIIKSCLGEEMKPVIQKWMNTKVFMFSICFLIPECNLRLSNFLCFSTWNWIAPNLKN